MKSFGWRGVGYPPGLSTGALYGAFSSVMLELASPDWHRWGRRSTFQLAHRKVYHYLLHLGRRAASISAYTKKTTRCFQRACLQPRRREATFTIIDKKWPWFSSVEKVHESSRQNMPTAALWETLYQPQEKNSSNHHQFEESSEEENLTRYFKWDGMNWTTRPWLKTVFEMAAWTAGSVPGIPWWTGHFLFGSNFGLHPIADWPSCPKLTKSKLHSTVRPERQHVIGVIWPCFSLTSSKCA